MKKFTIIKKDNFNIEELVNLLKGMIGFYIEIIEKDEYLIIKHDYENEKDISDLLVSYSRELLVDILAYNSTLVEKYDFELDLALNNLKYLNNGIYTIKTMLEKIPNKCAKQALDGILSQSGISIDFVKEFVKYDLNVSKASKGMFIHRNTMNYKLDKLNSISNFDLRKFSDAFILYNLIINL